MRQKKSQKSAFGGRFLTLWEGRIGEDDGLASEMVGCFSVDSGRSGVVLAYQVRLWCPACLLGEFSVWFSVSRGF